MPLYLKTESWLEKEESQESDDEHAHFRVCKYPSGIQKRTAEKSNVRAFGASKNNLDLLVVGTEVLKQDVVGQVRSNSRFYLKICYL